ncbi:MAG: CHAT domain-containing protein [Dinoroseobacter sp.]|nr:CHAT domain-containing protein [Dinoroseobacter sp.]
MSDFVSTLAELADAKVRDFIAGLTLEQRTAAQSSLLECDIEARSEGTQLRLLQTLAVLQLEDMTRSISVSESISLIWPESQTNDGDPRGLLELSADWPNLVQGLSRDVVYLARARQMKDLALIAPFEEAKNLRANALEVARSTNDATLSAALRADAQFLDANIRVDRVAAGASDNAEEDLSNAITTYEYLRAHWGPENHPRDHLQVLSNLASCLKNRANLASGPSSARDTKDAVELLQHVVRMARLQEDVETASLAQFNLAILHFQRANRETAEAREVALTESIEGFAALREIWSGEVHRGSRVKAMVNQAVVTSHRGRLRTAREGLKDFEAAEALCAGAIDTFHMPGNEGDLGRAWSQRGSARWSMSRRMTGATARAQLSEALKCHREAEEIWRRLDAVSEQASCLMDQAIVHASLGEAHIGAEALRSIDRGIAMFQRAYEMKVEAGDDFGAALVARNLASAWSNRGDYVAGAAARISLSKAIEAFDRTMTVYDSETDAQLLADIGAEKGAALLTRAGSLSGNERLKDLDEAIGLLERYIAMLEMPHDARSIASTSFNCGLAYAMRAKVLPSDGEANIDPLNQDARRAEALFDRALDVFEGSEDAVDAFDPLVALAELTTWQAQNGASDRVARLKRAIACADRAVATYTPFVKPRAWLSAAEVRCRALFLAEDRLAKGALQEVLSQGLRLVMSLPDTEGQEAALRAIAGVGDRLAVLCARQGDLTGALDAVTQGRSVRASRDFALADESKNLADLRTILFEARAKVDHLTELLEESGREDNETSAELELAQTDLTAAQTNLDTALADALQSWGLGRSDPAKLKATLGDHDRLAVPVISETGGGVLIVSGSEAGFGLSFLNLPGLTSHTLDRILETPETGWTQVYAHTFANVSQQVWDPLSPAAQRFMAALDRLLVQLWEILMGPLHAALDRGTPGGRRLGTITLIPPGRMAGLPLGAARAGHMHRPFLSDWPVAYSQSLTAWCIAHDRARTRATGPRHLLSIADPTEDLAVERNYKKTETSWNLVPKRDALGRPKRMLGWRAPGWTQFEPDRRTELLHRGATIPAVCDALSNASHAVFFCHGGWDRDRGTDSGLMLAATQEGVESVDGPWPGEMMTIDRLVEEAAELQRVRMCILAACETAPVGLLVPDEFSGFAHALSLSVPMVVSTLFPVTPDATKLLLDAALALHLGSINYSMPIALAQAQHAAAYGGDRALSYILEHGSPHPDPATLLPPAIEATSQATAIPVPISRVGNGESKAKPEALLRAPSPPDTHSKAELDLNRRAFYWAAYVAIGTDAGGIGP